MYSSYYFLAFHKHWYIFYTKTARCSWNLYMYSTFLHSWQLSSHLTDCCLHYGIQTSLRRVQVTRDFLFANFSFKLLSIASQWQDIVKTESRLAGICTIGAGVLTSCLHLTDIWQHLFINKRPKTWKMQKRLRINARNKALIKPLPNYLICSLF